MRATVLVFVARIPAPRCCDLHDLLEITEIPPNSRAERREKCILNTLSQRIGSWSETSLRYHVNLRQSTIKTKEVTILRTRCYWAQQSLVPKTNRTDDSPKACVHCSMSSAFQYSESRWYHSMILEFCILSLGLFTHTLHPQQFITSTASSTLHPQEFRDNNINCHEIPWIEKISGC